MKNIIIPIILLFVVTLSSCLPPPDPFDPGDPVDPLPVDIVLAFEVEDAIVNDIFLVGYDLGASQGSFLYQPSSVPNTNVGSVSASIPFSVDHSDEYFVWVRMFGPSTSEDAAYAGINGDMKRVYPTNTGVYEWVNVGNWTLSSGSHSIDFGHAESNTRLDLVVIANKELSTGELDDYVNATIIPPPSIIPECGNNILEEGEECDLGEDNGLVCSPTGGSCTYCSKDCKNITVHATSPIQRDEFSLLGNPDFEITDLSSEGRIWHERLIRGFESQDHSMTTSKAESDNLYNYGRQLHTHIQSLLWAFRATGDLRILDEVDRLTQLMRAKLSDSWCASAPDPHYNYHSPDGYLNWRWRGDSSTHNCRDVHRLDESKTHGMIATIAYAYEVNRNMDSPKGINYGERADFWKDYLFNTYEKKWQARMGIDDALTRVSGYNAGHAQLSNIKMHYYMYKLSGESKYMERSKGMSAQVLEGLRTSSTENGLAYVWSRRWIAEQGESAFYLHPTTYSRYVLADFAELYVEGIEPWDDDIHMPRFANALVQYVMDDGYNSFARDIGGGIDRAGIPASPESDWSRFDRNRYSISPYIMVIPWDTTGKGAQISKEVYNRVESSRLENPRLLYIPSGMIFYYEWINK